MSVKLKFSVDKIELIEEVNKSQFAKVKLWAFASGDNLHDLPVSEETLKKRADTIYDKPLVWIYNSATNDIGGHHEKEVPCGFVHRENNEIKFEKAEDDSDRLFLTVEAMIWKRYSGDILNYFERDGNEKPVSVEIQVLETQEREDGKTEITDYCYAAITVLGSKVTPAIPDAKAEIIEFSKDKEECEKLLAEFSSSTNEENLNINNDTQEKEVEQMVFNKEEFAVQFSMTAGDVMDMMRETCGSMKYQVEDREYSKYWMIDYDENYMYAYDEQNGGKCAIPYSIEDGKVNCDFENTKPCKTMTQWVILEEPADDDDSVMMAIAKAKEDKEAFAKSNEEPENKDDNSQQNMSANQDDNQDGADTKDEFSTDEMKEKFTQMETKLNDMEEKFSTLSQENETLKTENGELKKFKSDIEDNDKNAKIEFTLNEVMEAGMPKEKADEFRTKALEFSAENIHIWVNEVKANALDFAKEQKNKDEGFTRIGLGWSTETEKKKGLWS